MEKRSQIHGSNSEDIVDDSLGKDEQDQRTIGAIEDKSFIPEAFPSSYSSWKGWRGIEDEGSLEQRSIDEDNHDEQGEKSLIKNHQESHRMDSISERNFVSESFTTYIRPEMSSKSWEMETAQPLVSSGQSRTHTLPRTRSLPEIRIPDDYETIVDDKLETNSLQDSVVTFLSADQLHSGTIKGSCISDKDSAENSRESVGGNFMGDYAPDPSGHGASVKAVATTSLSNSGAGYSFDIHDAGLAQHIDQETANIGTGKSHDMS